MHERDYYERAGRRYVVTDVDTSLIPGWVRALLKIGVLIALI